MSFTSWPRLEAPFADGFSVIEPGVFQIMNANGGRCSCSFLFAQHLEERADEQGEGILYEAAPILVCGMRSGLVVESRVAPS